jgi:hypothetical protein
VPDSILSRAQTQALLGSYLKACVHTLATFFATMRFSNVRVHSRVVGCARSLSAPPTALQMTVQLPSSTEQFLELLTSPLLNANAKVDAVYLVNLLDLMEAMPLPEALDSAFALQIVQRLTELRTMKDPIFEDSKVGPACASPPLGPLSSLPNAAGCGRRVRDHESNLDAISWHAPSGPVPRNLHHCVHGHHPPGSSAC